MNKTAVVVGGGKSLGAFLCKHLATQNYKVAVLDIVEENAIKIADEINKAGGYSKAYYVNSTDEQSVVQVFGKIEKDYTSIDLLVYNAGVAKASVITDFQVDAFKWCMDVNLTGYFLCAREAARIMIKNETKGRIIYINSKSGKVGSKFNAGYCASKFGAVGLTQTMALDLAPNDITVNNFMLGNMLKSDMFQSLIPQYANKLGIKEEEVLPYYIDKVPLKRGLEFIDVANALTFYASEKAGYCTGQSINLTGGQVMF
jgi:Dehydrogenases with different specificities (related to short-chain alcohol dehydrogenases)